MNTLEALRKWDTNIGDAPPNKFCMLNSPMAAHKFIVFKYLQPVHTSDVALSVVERKLNILNIHYLQSVGILFAYLFHIPDMVVRNFDTYFTAIRPSSLNHENFTGVDLLYQSPYINVYESQDGAALVSSNNIGTVVTPDLVRKSNKR